MNNKFKEQMVKLCRENAQLICALEAGRAFPSVDAIESLLYSLCDDVSKQALTTGQKSVEENLVSEAHTKLENFASQAMVAIIVADGKDYRLSEQSVAKMAVSQAKALIRALDAENGLCTDELKKLAKQILKDADYVLECGRGRNCEDVDITPRQLVDLCASYISLTEKLSIAREEIKLEIPNVTVEGWELNGDRFEITFSSTGPITGQTFQAGMKGSKLVLLNDGTKELVEL
jgi:hypothetical protein